MILLDHKAECARSSMFFHVVDGLVWAACRYCGATAVRPPVRPVVRKSITVKGPQ